MKGRSASAWASSRFTAREGALWTAAGALALSVHVAVAAWAMQDRMRPPVEDEAPSAIMIDMAPIASAPEAVETQMAEGVTESTAAMAVPAENVAEPVDEPVETAAEPEAAVDEDMPAERAEAVRADASEVAETDVAEAAPVAPAEVLEESDAERELAEPSVVDAAPVAKADALPTESPLPAVPEATDAAAAMPAQVPAAAALHSETQSGREAARKEQQKKERATEDAARKAADKKEAARKQKEAAKKKAAAASQAAAKAKAAAEPSKRAAASESSIGTKPTLSPAKWQSRLLAHLERRKRYPPSAKRKRLTGTAQVRFSIDGGGAVLSVSLTRSTGHPELDKAAVDMVRRASPVPAPPPGANRTISVPVSFTAR